MCDSHPALIVSSVLLPNLMKHFTHVSLHCFLVMRYWCWIVEEWVREILLCTPCCSRKGSGCYLHSFGMHHHSPSGDLLHPWFPLQGKAVSYRKAVLYGLLARVPQMSELESADPQVRLDLQNEGAKGYCAHKPTA